MEFIELLFRLGNLRYAKPIELFFNPSGNLVLWDGGTVEPGNLNVSILGNKGFRDVSFKIVGKVPASFKTIS
jgi:hypothetical protein